MIGSLIILAAIVATAYAVRCNRREIGRFEADMRILRQALAEARQALAESQERSQRARKRQEPDEIQLPPIV